MIFAGIDPGLCGGLGLVDQDGALVLAVSLPVMGEGSRRQLDGAALAKILTPFDIRSAVVENVHAMPGQGVASTFRFGRAMGAAEGVLQALRIPTANVEPTAWKKHFGLSRDKDDARRLAVQTFPEADFHRKLDHNRAEAALLGLFARHRHMRSAA